MQSVHSSRAARMTQAIFAIAVFASVAPAFGDVFTLRNGMQLTGSTGKIGKMGEAPVAADSGGAGRAKRADGGQACSGHAQMGTRAVLGERAGHWESDWSAREAGHLG